MNFYDFLQLCKYYVKIICTKDKRKGEQMEKHIMNLLTIQWKLYVSNTKQGWKFTIELGFKNYVELCFSHIYCDFLWNNFCREFLMFGHAHIFFSFIMTNVACVVGPSVNTLRVQLIFPCKPSFCNLFEFPKTKSIKKSISSTP
jgi:hypothetical protein